MAKRKNAAVKTRLKDQYKTVVDEAGNIHMVKIVQPHAYCHMCGAPILFMRDDYNRAVAVNAGIVSVIPDTYGVSTVSIITETGKIYRGKICQAPTPGSIAGRVLHSCTCCESRSGYANASMR